MLAENKGKVNIFKLLKTIIFHYILRQKSEIVIDITKFKPCEGKIVGIWSWKSLRTEKYIAHLRSDGKITVKKIE